MRERKNVLLLFSKVPEAGLVKTRLTTLKDGIFAPEVASGLYHCMLFDVVEIICAAMAKLEARAVSDVEAVRNVAESASNGAGAADAAPTKAVRDTYELVISTTPASNVEVMRKLFADAGEWPRELVVIADEGANFDEHYNHAFDQAWERGADCILSMGADMPALTVNDVVAGFEALHRLDGVEGGGIVLAPDQEMGVSVVGWTRGTDFDHSGVFYNQEGLTVLPAYIQKARRLGLPAIYLPPIPDVDTMADLRHNITLVEALNYCAPFDGNTPPWRTADALEQMGWSEVRVMPNSLHDPREHIDL
ncbi:MAG: DUF2064 domain-containing protein [Eggerthellaceae bacterium]|nr:DUF2064 domain-containing protein [Eggerthellaceae bacterium]